MKGLLASLKESIGLVMLACTLLMALGVNLYKVNTLHATTTGMTQELQDQKERLNSVEQRAQTLERQRSEDLTLLRNDIRRLKEDIQNMDNKRERLVRGRE